MTYDVVTYKVRYPWRLRLRLKWNHMRVWWRLRTMTAAERAELTRFQAALDREIDRVMIFGTADRQQR